MMSPELCNSPYASLFEALRYSHIAVGGCALVFGLLQIALPHGGSRHRAMGRFYVLCMMISFATSFPMSLYSGNVFLSIIGVFSFYLALTGQRLYVAALNGRFSPIDKALSILFASSALLMAIFAVYFLSLESKNAGIILAVFAIVFGFMNVADIRDMWGTNRPNISSYWKYRHIGRMVGSYIAAVTAFLANVQPFGNTFLNWLLPTGIGTAFIWIQIGKYKRAAGQK